jgi:hypothetical protein
LQQFIGFQFPARYADLTARGLRQAEPDDPRYLVVADEVQRGTRDRDYGREIKSALQLIAEQSAALGDVLILAAQRPEHSIPPNVRFNCNVHLRMLGQGYFHLQADGFPTRSGRVAYLTPDQSLEAIASGQSVESVLSVDALPDILGSKAVKPGRMVATLYLGQPGSGKTHALHAHPNGHLRLSPSAGPVTVTLVFVGTDVHTHTLWLAQDTIVPLVPAFHPTAAEAQVWSAAPVLVEQGLYAPRQCPTAGAARGPWSCSSARRRCRCGPRRR